jgi:hypothetical protein
MLAQTIGSNPKTSVNDQSKERIFAKLNKEFI